MTQLKAQLERFYAQSLPDQVISARDERLTDVENPDLFVAHLGTNDAYFGSIDKTLSGFVVLNDDGDNYTLYDGRDTRAVYWQDHDDRDLVRCFRSIEDYLQARHEELDHPPEIEGAVVSGRVVSTHTLAKRYQWAVWLFDQNIRRDPVGTIPDHSLAKAVDQFCAELGTIEKARALYDTEAASLHDDVHLAMFWLLMAFVRADRAWLNDVCRLGPAANELFTAFVTALAPIEIRDELLVLPGFRKRRAEFLQQLGKYSETRDELQSCIALSLIADPDADTIRKLMVLHVCTSKTKTPEVLLDLLPELKTNRFVALVLEVCHDVQLETIGSAPARELMQWLAEPANSKLLTGAHIQLLALSAPLVTEQVLVHTAGLALLPKSPMHYSLLELLTQTGKHLDAPDWRQHEALCHSISAIRSVYSQLTKNRPPDVQAAGLEQASLLEEPKRNLLVEKLLAEPEIFAIEAVTWALVGSLTHEYPRREPDLIRAMEAIGFGAESAVEQMRDQCTDVPARLRADLEGLTNWCSSAPTTDSMEANTRRRAASVLLLWLAAS